MKIVLASNNLSKIAELQMLLTGTRIEVVSVGDFPNNSDVAETGLTFIENAIIKARHACRMSGLPAIGDDSGLEVDALNGQPGIYSSRYAGPNATASDNMTKLLSSMQGVPESERTARFQCLLVFLEHPNDPTPIVCQGTWEGRILESPQGQSGFGYDPVFFVPEEGCSAAELSTERKNQISHRGIASRAIVKQIAAHFGV